MKTKRNLKNKNNKKTRKRIFNKEDYKSNDGMLTSIWGPGMWHFLHSMSFNYPVEPTQNDKNNYKNFILSLKDILPCGKCRKNLNKNFKKLPFPSSGKFFVLYSFRLKSIWAKSSLLIFFVIFKVSFKPFHVSVAFKSHNMCANSI